MCGFLLSLNFKISKEVFHKNLNLIEHRGRDGSKIVTLNKENNNILIGFNRLSIIDNNERSMQPFTDENENIFLLFNGEIYNFLELRDELKEIYNFKTTSDTEVIFAIYKIYGIDILLKKIKGMYAISIIDLLIDKIYCFTDKTNQKPLYFFKEDNTFLVSSECKSILNLIPKIKFNKNVIKKEIFFGDNFNHETIFQDVIQLDRSTILNYDLKNHEINKNEYSFYKHNLEKIEKLKKKNILDHYDDVFYETVKKHCLSDVPLGVLYSGGLDSSIIATYTKRLKDKKIPLFFYNSKDNSHYKYAKLINKNNDFEIVSVTDSDLNILRDFIDIVYSYEKNNKSEGIFLSAACNVARKEGYKVLLSGDGADEVFGGYEFHTNFNQKVFYHKRKYLINLFKFLRKFTSFNPFAIEDTKPENLSYLFQPLNFSSIEVLLNLNFNNFDKIKKWNKYLEICENLKPNHLENAFLNYTLNNRLHIYTHRADRIGMSKNVEIRTPFLYEDIINLSLNTDFDYKIKQNLFFPANNKYILKKLAKKIGVPDQIINRPKVGTEFNLNKFFQNLINKINIKHSDLIFDMSQYQIKYILNNSYDPQKYTYQYAILTIEILGRLFIDKMDKDEVYNELNRL